MKDVKFRAYIKHLKWIVPVVEIHFDTKHVEVDLSNGQGDTSDYNFDEVELMQYTGLIDETTKEIYEGDIVKIYDNKESDEGWNEEVIFHRACYMAGDENLLINVHFRCEVVGNIYDNSQS